MIALRLKLVEENKVKSWLFVELTGFLFHLVDTHIAPIYEITWCNKKLLFINDIFFIVVRCNPIIFKQFDFKHPYISTSVEKTVKSLKFALI